MCAGKSHRTDMVHSVRTPEFVDMAPSAKPYDVAIIGGGLSGLCAALRLSLGGVKTILLNTTINSGDRSLGGFARFSGAKFSLPPAGMGLVPIVGSSDSLFQIVEQVISLLGIEHKRPHGSTDLGIRLDDTELARGVHLRNYDSIVLMPSEMDVLIDDLETRVRKHCEVIDGKCLSLTRSDMQWHSTYVTDSTTEEIVSDVVFFAGGRMGSDVLSNAGCRETHGKGLDLGIRVEFPDKQDLFDLRKLGPDAKIISGRCRTFCLNVPGKIYRYPLDSIEIPGGIVAAEEELSANVGLLYRSSEKMSTLGTVLSRAQEVVTKENQAIQVPHGFLGDAQNVLFALYGNDVVSSLCTFGSMLHQLGLVDWNKPHIVHLPLLDWHWPTFSLANTLSSSRPDLIVLGDSSGHARGLLQAAISGYIAAMEYSS